MKELVIDNRKRTNELMDIVSRFSAKVGNAYVELLSDLIKYGEDPKNVELYKSTGYDWVVKPEIGALYSTEKTINNLLENFYIKA